MAIETFGLISALPFVAGDVTIPGPQVSAGKSRTLQWTTFFETPFDPHYDITLWLGPDPTSTDFPDLGPILEMWSQWTSISIC